MRVEVALLGAGPLFAETHWFGRQVLCPGEECLACSVSRPRCFGYLAVAQVSAGHLARASLLELSVSSYERLAGLVRMEGMGVSRGLRADLSRRFAKSPLVCTPIVGEAASGLPAMDEHGLLQAFSALYVLPGPTPGEEVDAWSKRVRPAVMLQVEQAMRAG